MRNPQKIINISIPAIVLCCIAMVAGAILQWPGIVMLGLAALTAILAMVAWIGTFVGRRAGSGEDPPASVLDGILCAVPDILLLVNRSGAILKKNTAGARFVRGNQLPGGLEPVVRQLWSRSGEEIPAAVAQENLPYRPADSETRYEVRVIPRESGDTALVLLHDHRSDDELGDLVATLSHQVKTPLTAIRLALSLLQKNHQAGLNAHQRELIQTALEETDKLGLNVEDLLDLTQIEDGSSILDVSRVDPKELLREVAARLTPLAGRRDIRIQVTSNAQPRAIPLDRIRIRTVLENLVINAVRHSPRGSSINLETSFDSVRQTAILSVQDSSSWLDSHKMLHVLDRFLTEELPQPPAQDDSAKSSNGKTPHPTIKVEDVLGFFVARQIIRAHNGTFKIFCRRKEGLDMEIHLPLQRERPVSTEAEPTPEQKENPYIRPLTRRYWGRITPNL